MTLRPPFLQLHQQLRCISWFNRCLNEPIARRANQEDDCKGRFWEGRFKCSRIDSPGGVLACGVYIDLNPIRSGLAETPETSDFTSVQDRVRGLLDQSGFQRPPSSDDNPETLPVTPKLMPTEFFTDTAMAASEYLELVESTGRAIRRGKSGKISQELEGILTRLQLHADNWPTGIKEFGRLFKRIVGTTNALSSAAAQAGKSWFKGKAAAQYIFT
jgi:hypothetical protein